VHAEPPITDDNERTLWAEYQSSRNARIRDRLLALYEPLARTIAARLYGVRSDDSVTFGDYLQYGRVGLMEAVDRYEPEREVPFVAYSSQRIRGSILNGIAKESELSAQRRFWKERWRDRVESLSTAVAPDAERASLSDMVTITIGLAVGAIVEGVNGEHDLPDPNPRNDPYAQNELRQLSSTVMQLLERLPDNERTVMKGHYVEHLEFQILAQRLSLTKGRISQIHARALVRLREWLEQGPKLDRKL
jgi:RNA polymerase sigma factor for flagellar operon FliA